MCNYEMSEFHLRFVQILIISLISLVTIWLHMLWPYRQMFITRTTTITTTPIQHSIQGKKIGKVLTLGPFIREKIRRVLHKKSLK